MFIDIFFIGLLIGILLDFAIESICSNITKIKIKSINRFPPIVYALLLEVLYWKLGLNILFIKSAVMSGILTIISFVDLRHRIIPNFMVVTTLVIGILFSLFSGYSFIDTILGMSAGGGILFLLALIPNAMGGGDIKLMFSIGAFLGLNKTLWAIVFAFILSSIVSIGLILFKIKGTKDFIPFGPFLSFGSFISLLL